MQLNYIIEKQDHIDFNMFHIKHSRTMRRSLIIQKYLFPIIFLLIPYPFSLSSGIPIWYWLCWFIPASILWIALYEKYAKWMVARRISKMLNEGKNSAVPLSVTLEITEDYIIEKSDKGEAKINLKEIESIELDKKHIYIYVSAVSAVIVPNSAFKDETEKEEFVKKIKLLYEKTLS